MLTRSPIRIYPIGLVLILIGGVLWAHLLGAGAPERTPRPTPRVVLAELKAGNARYVASARTLSTDTRHDGDWRRRLLKGQHPLAAILCCADSRVVPEFIFDQRIGSIFEIRNAGNVVDEDVLASLEYAVEHLHVPVIVVMGHKGCGAIEAVEAAGDQLLPEHLRALQEHMTELRSEITQLPRAHGPAFLNHLAEANAHQQALRVLRESEPIREAAQKGQVAVVVGLYDMETGEVLFEDRVLVR